MCGYPLTNDTAFNPATATYYCGIRENNKQIFIQLTSDTTDKLHYDFNLNTGDSFYFYYAPLLGWHYVTSVDSELINTSYRRTLTFDGTEKWIEGIGSKAGLFESNLLVGNVFHALLCYSENGNVHYSLFGTCNTGTGINGPDLKTTHKVYPNPVTDKLNITVDNNSVSEIILYDMTSRRLLQQKFVNESSINTEQLAKGFYFYELRIKDGFTMNGKIVKE